jgi:hypothetical protein
MIAPRRPFGSRTSAAQAMRRARRIVAESLFSEAHDVRPAARPIASWKGWLFLAWMLVVAAGYAASVLWKS